jgi:hypothetical protein
MNELNVSVSYTNLLQMDRHQDDANRTPVIHQSANAEYERENAARRLEKPNETQEPEGKNVDSEAKKRYRQAMVKKRKQQSKQKELRGRADGTGRFCDITV